MANDIGLLAQAAITGNPVDPEKKPDNSGVVGVFKEIETRFLVVEGAAAASSVPPLDPVDFATTANITLSGSQTVDGVASGNGKRALVKDQTTKTENTVYVTNSGGAWTKATDANTGPKIFRKTVLVLAGTANGGATYQNSNEVSPAMGTDDILFTLRYVPGTGSAANTAELTAAREGQANLLANLTDIRSDFAAADASEATTRADADAPMQRVTQDLYILPPSAVITGGRFPTAESYISLTIDSDGYLQEGLGTDGIQEYGKLKVGTLLASLGAIGVEAPPIYIPGVGYAVDLLLDANSRAVEVMTEDNGFWALDPDTGLLAKAGGSSSSAYKETYTSSGTFIGPVGQQALASNDDHNAIYVFVVHDQSVGYGANAGSGSLIYDTPVDPGFALMMDNSQATKTAHILPPSGSVYTFGDNFLDLVEAAIAGAYETQCSSFAKYFIDAHNTAKGWKPKVLMMISARGGAPDEAIRRGTQPYNAIPAAMKKAVSIVANRGLGERLIFSGVLTDHGQEDASLGARATDYSEYLLLRCQHFNADMRAITNQSEPVRLFVQQPARQGTNYDADYPEIGVGIALAAKRDPRIVIVGPGYQHLAQFDDVAHFAPLGQNTSGITKSNSAVQALLAHGYPPTDITRVWWTAADTLRWQYSRSVTIDTSAARVPVPAGNGRGFVIFDGTGSPPTFSGITKVDDAAFTAGISGDTMTVSALASGKLRIGSTIAGSGVTAGTYLSSFIPNTGGTGGTGTYKISPAQTVAGGTSMTASSNTLEGALSAAPANPARLGYLKTGCIRSTVPIGADINDDPVYSWARVQDDVDR